VLFGWPRFRLRADSPGGLLWAGVVGVGHWVLEVTD
jgi:hypothetical protein